MNFYIKHPGVNKYLGTQYIFISGQIISLLKDLLTAELKEDEKKEIRGFLDRINNTFEKKLHKLYNFQSLTLSEVVNSDQPITDAVHYSLAVPGSFNNKKIPISDKIIESPKKLFENYVTAIEMGKSWIKIRRIISEQREFLISCDKKNKEKFQKNLADYQKQYNRIINIGRYSGEPTEYQAILNNKYVLNIGLASYKVKKELPLDYDKWGIESVDNKNKLFHEKGYVILYQRGEESLFFSLREGGGGLAAAQIFTTERDAFVSARRRLGVGGNFSIFELDLKALKEVSKNGAGAKSAPEINSYIEQESIEEFFANNEIEKIREKLKEYEHAEEPKKQNRNKI